VLRSIVHVAGEMAPLVKVGGLADVVGALSLEQARQGHRVTVAIPAYSTVQVPEGWTCRELGGCDVPWGMGVEPARFDVLELDRRRLEAPHGAGVLNGGPSGVLRVLRVRHAGDRKFFDRPGIYDDPRTGEGYADNPERFLFFNRAALEGLARMRERFDVLHAHDHQAGWAPCFVRTHEAYEMAFDGAATVFTIHNLGYQGLYDSWVLALAGFGGEVFYPGGPFEYWGRVNFMKVGIAFADLLSTVSPRYAEEIQSSGEYGFGLEGVLARRRADLRGILNGIDVDVWNPATDPHLPAHYDAEHLDGKAQVHQALAQACGFPNDGQPIVGIVSRLAEQKGFDLIEEAREDLLELGARFVVLGAGTPRYVELLRGLAFERPDRFHYRHGFDEPFAHLIEGGADLFLMPSRYEPCGLNQMYSMRYGTIPVVRATGGLADTVTEFDPMTRLGTGFTFQRFDAGDMVVALRRGVAMHREPELWRALQRNGMHQDFSWGARAREYEALYDEAVAKVARGAVRTLEKVRATI
jgi:starch synthase